MDMPIEVKDKIKDTLDLLKVYIGHYLKRFSKTIKQTENHIDYKIFLPVEKDFKKYIYQMLIIICENGIEGTQVSCDKNNNIWIVIDGYRMPVHVHFHSNNNIYSEGFVNCGVWINDNVATKG